MHDRTEITPDRCAALVAPHPERLTFAVVHASIGRAGPRLMQYGVPIDAIDIVGQLRMALAARPVSATGLAAVYRYRDAETNRRNGQPYATLSATERSRLVSGLADLPGQP
jgi:hypothetical protein